VLGLPISRILRRINLIPKRVIVGVLGENFFDPTPGSVFYF